MHAEIRDYLTEVRSHLHLDPATEMHVVRELNDYFQEKVDELQQAGVPEKDAPKVAIECCGRARVIARRMYEAHSRGSWTEAAVASLPHLIIACLFIAQLWRHPVVAPIAFTFIVCVTLYAWWHSKPSWLYPWVGYSLLPLLIVGYASRHTLEQAATFLVGEGGTFPSVWTLLPILALCVFSIWIIVRTTIRVVRHDWILASLMLVPLPIVGGWLLNLEQDGGLFQGNAAAVHLSDTPMALALITLGVTSATFIRLRQRVLKVVSLVSIGTIALAMVGQNFWGSLGLFSLLATSFFLLILVLLIPALLEAKIGHGEGDEWWENEWLQQPSPLRR